MTLTIVGLGPGDAEDITRRAWRILQDAPRLYLRTARHPAVDALNRPFKSFDALYEGAENFDSLYETIAERVLELAAEPEGVVYAVPGHPLVGERTVTLLLERAGEIPLEIIDGMSFIEPTLTMLGIDGINGLQIHDAAEIAQMYHPPLNPDQPVLLAQVYSQMVASDVKLTLMNQYPDDHPVTLIHGAGAPDSRREDMPLYEIDRSEHLAHMTTLYLPPLSIASSFQQFQETIAHLRAPEGCPWDREQTHQSLRPHLLEETYEVLEALDAGDLESLCEELGDLLLQVVLHSQIAIDEGSFTMNDIIAGVNSKIIRRHPHVWGDEHASTVEELHQIWERQKAKEKNGQGENDKQEKRESRLDGVPAALPALMQAEKYQKKAADVGFDWASIDPVLDKIFEEIEEIKAAQQNGLSHEELTGEVGDLLFAVVNWARWLKVNPETALRETNQRFRNRFGYIEQQAMAQNRTLETMTLDEMDLLWEEAKRQQ
ncbi:MAG TPA: nucleoside triphosphate pyrophosphohydrolase [Aggregatilineales bacterium]|nr:nucleoside triphosphate pyrophosphohydrolase [Aggregatilineales bacterium]